MILLDQVCTTTNPKENFSYLFVLLNPGPEAHPMEKFISERQMLETKKALFSGQGLEKEELCC
jgi:hypothetical protein